MQVLRCLGVALVTASRALAATPIDAVAESGRVIVEGVREAFYDADAARSWAEKHKGLGAGVSPGAWPGVARAALAELHASHTDYIAVDDPRHAALRAIFHHDDSERETIGIDAVKIDGRWFVSRVYADSPARAMELKRGDEIVACDGAPFNPVRSLADKSSVRLTLRHQEGAATEDRSVPVRRMGVRAEWLQAQESGTRVETIGDVRVGVVPVLSGAAKELRDALDKSIRSTLIGCDALVIDFRDGYGGCSPDWARLFARDVPLLEGESRRGKRRTETQWRGPLVVLINGGTRSGKEMITRSLQRTGRATIVGERSAGAVLGGSVIDLPDQGLLFLAVEDVRVDGERLEGVGVTPDIVVADHLPYAGGRDPQLERALEVAAKLGRFPR